MGQNHILSYVSCWIGNDNRDHATSSKRWSALFSKSAKCVKRSERTLVEEVSWSRLPFPILEWGLENWQGVHWQFFYAINVDGLCIFWKYIFSYLYAWNVAWKILCTHSFHEQNLSTGKTKCRKRFCAFATWDTEATGARPRRCREAISSALILSHARPHLGQSSGLERHRIADKPSDTVPLVKNRFLGFHGTW